MRRISPDSFTDTEYHTDPGKYLREHKKFKPKNTMLLEFARGVFWFNNFIRKEDDLDFVMTRTGKFMLEAVESRGGVVHADGLELFRDMEEPVIILGNHMGMLETILPFYFTNSPLSYVVKDSLTTIPVFNKILGGCEPIGLTRKDIGKDLKTLMEEGKKRLEAGRSIMLFPSGSRSFDFDKARFNTIGLRLSRATGAPMVPFAVKTDFLGRGRLMSYIGKVHPEKEVHFSFGKPIQPGKSGKEAHYAVIDEIAGKLESWGIDVYDSRDPQFSGRTPQKKVR